MGTQLRFMPEQASTIAADVDHLLYFFLAVSIFFTLLIFGAIFYFAIRYRRRSPNELPAAEHTGLALEIVWSVIPFGLTMIMFGWGASIFFKESRPPDNAMQIYVVGKQWMWKLQHMEGQREINELHIPINRPVRLTMTSEDVIHSFFVPDFRTKQDVVPGRYTTTWFEATKPGKYHLFCAEYCGTKHSGMIGWVYAMEPQDYAEWLAGGPTGSMADAGARLFDDLACGNCHKTDTNGRCPNLVGVFGSTVRLAGGGTVRADEAYIRESILDPDAKVVEGYQPLMPTFQGQITEEGVVQLIEYIKSLSPKPGTLIQQNGPLVPSSEPAAAGASPGQLPSGNQ
ncbi:MAG: cytochrome c oxidase subunit II [Acidobacteriia bacterium]|nr:cytochrome c oxidase subunit II [Terriglobia bacterium]